jgi:hypothetical protein
MVAVMTDLLDLEPDDLVLEIGTGRGYQAACSPSWPAGCIASNSSTSWPNGQASC